MPPDEATFGFPDECQAFAARNAAFIERLPRLKAAIELSDAPVPVDGLQQQTIMLLCRLVREDFMEILLLAANGYGSGATKLLRGLYEKVVTAYYLIDYPEKARDFADFGLIHIHRIVSDSAAMLGEGGAGVRPDLAQRAKEMSDRYVKEGRSKVNWSGTPFRQMADGVKEVRHFFPVAYTEASFHLHPSVMAILDRVDFRQEGKMVFDGSAQHDSADGALTWAHVLFLHALAIQAALFHLTELAELVKVCLTDWDETWPNVAKS